MEQHIAFYCNNTLISEKLNPSLTVLDFLRNNARLTGTKEGCREGDCGACTILLGTLADNSVTYKAVNSCLLPLGDVHGKHVISVEGVNLQKLNLIQQSMVDEGGSQCGFCTPGFIMSMTGFLLNNPNPTIEGGIAALDGNICRCTGYAGIKRSVEKFVTAANASSTAADSHIGRLVEIEAVPAYMLGIPEKLKTLSAEIKQKQKHKPGDVHTAIGGGTDLFVQKWEKMLDTDAYFINRNETRKGIKKKNDFVVIGGNTTAGELLASKIIRTYFPAAAEGLKLFGSMPIRNRATVAGNIVNASPIADMVNILLALNAVVVLRSGKERRTIALHDLYIGYKQLAKSADEIIEEVIIPVPGGEYYFNYEKVSRRTYLDIASVNSSVFIKMQDGLITEARISAGGVGPVPYFLKAASAAMVGKPVNAQLAETAAKTAMTEISPISDARGSIEYKRLLLYRMICLHFLKLFPASVSIEEVV